ncbi:MAG: radical SAM protein [Candidatus Nanoarchaeia archaeon]|nr:radical SAM protein [Candidatus Nanoarchaeia archaeon]MDD5358133.1 radical SAM protein [Candidatus Nanoarchaeia archaeon]MDD5589320.1 radical SAM protein [Candidatus Nanoarchaeia archaeon]
MSKKILLISPLEDFLLTPKEFPPLGILYLSSFLKKNGYEVKCLHGNPDDINGDYDFYGISSSTPQYSKSKKFLERIRENNPSAKIILGGAHTTSPRCINEALKDGFDYVVKGQGEKALLNIVQGNESFGVVEGVNLDNEELNNFFPDREALDMKEYGYPLEGGRAATIITSRGCPYDCAFCANNCRKVSFVNTDSVMKEIDMLVNKYGFDRLLFLDDSFTLNKKRLISVAQSLKNYKLKYRCYARADNSADEDLLKLMLESGCVELGVGIESGSQKILTLMNKHTTVENNINFIQQTQKIGMSVNSFIMVGLPGESEKTIEDTRNFMEKAKPHKFGYNIFVPYPGSPITEKYDSPFTNGQYAGKSFRDFITLYGMPHEKAVTKAKTIDECFVSTPDLSREEIIDAYHKEFEKFVEITGFDPRRRGNRKS